jgi:LacI family transcriptional regulator
MAFGAEAALQRAGRRVPHDVTVVGFDDIPQAAATFPALTTVAQPIAEMSAIGVRLLLERIANRDAPYQRIELPTRLVVRESSGPPPSSG